MNESISGWLKKRKFISEMEGKMAAKKAAKRGV
jgi:hypothetical protein